MALKFTSVRTAGALATTGATQPAGTNQVTAGADATPGGAATGDVNDGVTFTVWGKTLTLADIAADATVEGKDLAELVADAWNNQANDTDKQLDGVNVTASVEGQPPGLYHGRGSCYAH